MELFVYIATNNKTQLIIFVILCIVGSWSSIALLALLAIDYDSTYCIT